MNLIDLVTALATVLVFVYLFCALLRAEEF
jgi:hypothetical protein